MQQDLRKLPGFHEVSSNQWPALFKAKIDQCNVIFDFTDITCDVKSKDIKRLALYELRDHVASKEHVLANSIYEQVVDMFGRNVFRTIQPPTYRQPELFDVEDEPTLEVAWPHIKAVYELFLGVMESHDFDIKTARAYIDQNFVLQLLQLFDSEDPRERGLLKATLYDRFLSLRCFIRQSINQMLLQFIYESERFNGVAEFLEILGTIVYDLVMPLNEEYKTVLTRVLLPLHKPTILSNSVANRPTDPDRPLRSVGLALSRLPVCRSRTV
ncbi:serine/threonine protein phosphatase 2A [Pochonia chlamydosporia 170]|uniref:Serine/threonine protein phosphatase 2A n=1 Tax=Pochonia chlamydosporia 170 TaxID=1380566 RepID=A0A179EWD3_METCM|nr:serine/threonine protein phosphatase 2A [Pochonia chlamydosporia 170]OAQ57494.1 serine/threonine protein phosphatase 2A [Pochonia chlamydosporia 170]